MFLYHFYINFSINLRTLKGAYKLIESELKNVVATLQVIQIVSKRFGAHLQVHKYNFRSNQALTNKIKNRIFPGDCEN